MKIAVLAWGSLVWDRRGLAVAGDFQPNGPMLPIEFCRVSGDGRLTLVIDEALGTPCVTYSAPSAAESLDTAIENLWVRENREGAAVPSDLRGQGTVGYVEFSSGHQSAIAKQRHPHGMESITAWAKSNGYDAAIWTALPSNFHKPGKAGVPFSVDAAVNCLETLDAARLDAALTYFRQAPPEVLTPVRAAVTSRWPEGHASSVPLFETLTSSDIGQLFSRAQKGVYFAAPGIQDGPAGALCALASTLGPDLIHVLIDFDERVFRMGFGSLAAVKELQAAKIAVRSSPGLRTGLLVVDDYGYIFTPTALYLEPDERPDGALNALRLTRDQVREAMSRLSPAAKAVAVAMATTPDEKAQIELTAVEVLSEPIKPETLAAVDRRIQAAPVVRFDLARQVRVYSAHLQYVEMKLNGAAIERHRIAIPASIQGLSGAEDLAGRLRTTFDLIEKGGKLSSKFIEDQLSALRRDFTPSLGKEHGRVVLKSKKSILEKRLDKLRADLETHQKLAEAELQAELDQSKKAIVEHYKPIVIANPPDAVHGLFTGDIETTSVQWLSRELDKVLPKAKTLISKMKLDVVYRDVTFETLNDPAFLKLVKVAFPEGDWDRVHDEFRAAGEGSVVR